jgi:hypothetical protein
MCTTIGKCCAENRVFFSATPTICLIYIYIYIYTVDPRKSNGLILEQLETRTKIREKFGLKLE